MDVSENLKELYSDFYDESITEWRALNGKYKAQNIIDISKNIQFDSVLEVGCGEGAVLSQLSNHNYASNYYGLEISESGVEMTKSKNIKGLKSVDLFDGYKIPYDDNFFDLAICSHVMEHVEHERVLLKEILRVSKYQVFEVPIDFSFYVDKKANHFLSYGHINIYTPALFRFLLTTEKFNIISDKCCMYNNDILKMTYKNRKIAYYKVKLKRIIINLFPYLKGIKPNSYVVLTTKTT